MGGPDPEKRRRIIWELCETEKRYVDAIQLALELYAPPLEAMINKQKYNKLFNHLDEIFDINKALYDQMLDSVGRSFNEVDANVSIANVIISFVCLFGFVHVRLISVRCMEIMLLVIRRRLRRFWRWRM